MFFEFLGSIQSKISKILLNFDIGKDCSNIVNLKTELELLLQRNLYFDQNEMLNWPSNNNLGQTYLSKPNGFQILSKRCLLFYLPPKKESKSESSGSLLTKFLAAL